jgi:hypothetical protein
LDGRLGRCGDGSTRCGRGRLGTRLWTWSDGGACGACGPRTSSPLLALIDLLLPLGPLALELFLNPFFSIENHAARVAVEENLVPAPTEEGALVLFEVQIGRVALGAAHSERHEARVSGRE